MTSKPLAWAPIALALALPPGATFAAENAVPAAAKEHLLERARTRLPTDWQVRASQRDDALVLFVTPPTAEAFSLLYDANASIELVKQLCPERGDRLWQEVGPALDIAVQPTILGKAGLRTSCKAVAAESPGT